MISFFQKNLAADPSVYQLRARAIILIHEIDRVLSLLRGLWLSASGVKKETWRRRIDESLDERIRLMAIRDASPAAL